MQQARNLAMDVGDRLGTLKFLIHDRDPVFTTAFGEVFKAEGLRIITTLPKTPRMNAICERVNGTLRRELLDRILIVGERHLALVLREYVTHYNGHRPATAGELLGPHLKRVPDGEPGGRRLWISWQVPVLRAHPDLEVVGPDATLGLIPLRLRDGVRADDLHFGELGYSREARASYQDFLAARRAGTLPVGVRFQVSLPTPYAIINTFCVQPDAQQILPAYEQAMLGEVARIATAIPHEDLALQWDVCIEMLQWDGRWENAPQFPGMEQVFADMFGRLSAAVPEDIELGFHLCYGDLDAAHFVDPVDATKMTELANLITASAGRPVAYVHMPVPAHRTDDAYYEPLSGLRLPPGTELYLGLVHVSDGVPGTRQRMAAAAKYVRDFGIASECGISRGRHPSVAAEFMRVYAGAAEAGPATAPDA